MILAAVGALAIGLSLGLLGSGGSILTVPVLVYLLGQEEKTAIAGSLLVVGAIAAAGGAQYAWKGRVAWRSVLWFGLPGMAGTVLGSRLAAGVAGALQLAVFALVMLVAAAMMLRPPASLARRDGDRRSAWKLSLDGVAVGLLTGFVGVGGGFLIVPALVLLGSLAMDLAVGTSLVIITLNAFTGFWKHSQVLASRGLALDWGVLALVAAIGVAGSVVGRKIGHRVPQGRLRQGFGVFLIGLGLFILGQKVPELLPGGWSVPGTEG